MSQEELTQRQMAQREQGEEGAGDEEGGDLLAQVQAFGLVAKQSNHDCVKGDEALRELDVLNNGPGQ